MKTTTTEAIAAFNKACDHAVSLGYEDIRATGWKIGFNNRKRAVGLCDYTKRQVFLSKAFMETNGIDKLYNTILHELAHALTPGDGHGMRWKRVFKHIGGDGNRLNRIADHAKSRWQVIDTRNGNVVAQYHRRPRRNIARCQLNNDPESYGKLILVENNG